MKKITLLLVLFISIISCTKDSNVTSDKILGTWGLYKDIDVLDGNTITEYIADPNYPTEITFLENKTFYISFYSDSIIIEGVEDAPDGTWRYLSDNKYRVDTPAEKTVIEFISENEFMMTYVDDDSEIMYYKRI